MISRITGLYILTPTTAPNSSRPVSEPNTTTTTSMVRKTAKGFSVNPTPTCCGPADSDPSTGGCYHWEVATPSVTKSTCFCLFKITNFAHYSISRFCRARAAAAATEAAVVTARKQAAADCPAIIFTFKWVLLVLTSPALASAGSELQASGLLPRQEALCRLRRHWLSGWLPVLI